MRNWCRWTLLTIGFMSVVRVKSSLGLVRGMSSFFVVGMFHSFLIGNSVCVCMLSTLVYVLACKISPFQFEPRYYL